MTREDARALEKGIIACRGDGGHSVTRVLMLALALAVCLAAGEAHAQADGVPPNQSLRDTPSACGPGSQSVRVCNDDFRSCNSVCTATALDPTADIASCSLNCCTKFNTCLRMRQCGARVVSCF
jgi:hypothetical protein